MNILSRILDHENEIFEEYQTKRKLLLRSIHGIDMNTLTQDQIYIMVHDLKAILDPIKICIHSIDHHISNGSLTKSDSVTDYTETKLCLYLLLNIRFGSFSSLENDETLETPESESSESLSSSSESLSSSSESLSSSSESELSSK
jgi:hypothetical protein